MCVNVIVCSVWKQEELCGDRAGQDPHRADAHQQPAHGGRPAEGGALPATRPVAGNEPGTLPY